MSNNSTRTLNNSSDIFAMLERELGPQRQELSAVIPITIVYFLIFLTGLFGNVSTCIVIIQNKYMHTATNYYLCNLVISDLLMLLLGLPQEMYWFWSAYPWVFGKTFCILRTMAAETSTYASILTITAFTFERYVAICHPMWAKTMSSLQRAIKMIIAVWIVSSCSSIPIWIQYGVVYVHDDQGQPIEESAVCGIRTDLYMEHFFEVSSLLFFVIPMTVISVLYGLIGLTIRRSALYRDSSEIGRRMDGSRTDVRRAIQQAKARLAVLKMLVAVVVAFFVCWAPFHTQRLLTAYMNTSDISAVPYLGQVLFFYVSGVLYYFSAVINPILYHIMSLKFRQAFKDTIFNACHQRKKPSSSHTTTVRHYKFCASHRPTNNSLFDRSVDRQHSGDSGSVVAGLSPGGGGGVANTPSFRDHQNAELVRSGVLSMCERPGRYISGTTGRRCSGCSGASIMCECVGRMNLDGHASDEMDGISRCSSCSRMINGKVMKDTTSRLQCNSVV